MSRNNQSKFPQSVRDEVVDKFLNQHIRAKVLVEEYSLGNSKNLYNWVRAHQNKLKKAQGTKEVVIHPENEVARLTEQNTLLTERVRYLEDQLHRANETEATLQTITMVLGEKIKNG